MAQSYNDTIYFNSGAHRVVNVTHVGNSAITYQYEKKNGNIRSGRIRKSMLGGYSVYDSNNKLVTYKELDLPEESGQAADSKKRGGGFGAGFITGVASTIGALIIIVFASF